MNEYVKYDKLNFFIKKILFKKKKVVLEITRDSQEDDFVTIKQIKQSK